VTYTYRQQTVSTYLDALYADGLRPSTKLSTEEAVRTIGSIGIFRFKGYVKAVRERLDQCSLDDVLALYYFDHGLRLHLFDLASTIEIQLKAYLIEAVYARTDNPFVYLERESYLEEFSLSRDATKDWEMRIPKSKPKEEIYQHYRDYYLNKYDFGANFSAFLASRDLIDIKEDINYPPLHYFVESATLGTVIALLSRMVISGEPIIKDIANRFGFYQPKVFMGYLLRLKEVRNRCAHHGRMFNRNYRSVKAIGQHKRLRRTIYDHRMLDVYYTLYRLLGREQQVAEQRALEQRLIAGSQYPVENHIEEFILNCMREKR